MDLNLNKTLKSIEKLISEADFINIEKLKKAYSQTLKLRSQLISVIYDIEEYIEVKDKQTEKQKSTQNTDKNSVALVINILFSLVKQNSPDTLFEILHRQAEESRAFYTWKNQHENGVLAIILHAFREEYFLQFFDGSGQGPQWLSKEELLAQLAARQEPLYCAGTDKDGASLAALLPPHYRIAPMADCRVRPQTLIEMAQNPIYEKNALEPLYLKPARFELGR